MKKKTTIGAALLTAATLNASQAPQNISPNVNKPKIEVVGQKNPSDSLASVLSFEEAWKELLDKEVIKSEAKKQIKNNINMQNLTNYYGEDVANSFIDNVLDKLLENPDEYIIINSKGEKLLNIDKLAHDALEGIDDIYNGGKEFGFWKGIIVVISGLLGSYGGIKLIEKRTNGNTNDNKKTEKC